jgi:L-ascorbate metabolism protein UlaG (beta-lactamase superfamily)
MELTKYEHACFTVEKDGKSIIVDPGSFTTDLTIPGTVVAIIMTHVHGDHFNEELLAEIIAKNPTALIIGPQAVTSQLSIHETRAVHGGDSFAVEGFDLDFYGDDHAVIHPSMPVAQNVGVLIEDRLYYPGDSFTMPEKSVDTLALPVAAPWLKISETIEFMKSVGARFTFPTHDAILSTAGKHLVDNMMSSFAETAGTEYKRIDGETIEID